MIAMLAATLLFSVQQPDTVTGVSQAVRAMLNRFSPPRTTDVAIDARFSSDTVWIGEQVELVTAAWFPRDLRDRLRRSPTLRAPALAGLWSAPTSDDPELAETRRQGQRVFDLFVQHQTLFPLQAGTVVAPPALLTYAVPASSSFFAPEELKSLSTKPLSLHVRAIPSELATRLGHGPTARAMDVSWRVPTGGGTVGTPISIELVLSGVGNVTLWPVPEFAWPGGIRIYPEPTEESHSRPDGMVRGVKRFRYTVVADSAAVLTLPEVSYPYFDPATVNVSVTRARARALVIQPAGALTDRVSVPVAGTLSRPIAGRLVNVWWPLMILLAFLPLLIRFWPSRERPARASTVSQWPLEQQLRGLVGMSGDSSPERIELALRQRGISREDAGEVRQWLRKRDRQRWGVDQTEQSSEGPLRRVVEQLRNLGASVFLLLLLCTSSATAQWDEGVSELTAGNPVAAESLFASVAAANPGSPDVWLNLGAARWELGDDVGAASAWLRGAATAPRDRRIQEALNGINSLPNDLRRRLPTIPFSSGELLIGALAFWLAGWLLWNRKPRLSQAAFGVTLMAFGTASQRYFLVDHSEALIRRGAVLRVSPVFSSPEIGPAPVWSLVRIESKNGEWFLVELDSERRGWLPAAQVAPLSPLD